MQNRNVIQPTDILETGEIRISQLARRLRLRPRTVQLWCEGWRGLKVYRGGKRSIVFLQCVRYGREIRTRPEWWDEFLKATQRRTR